MRYRITAVGFGVLNEADRLALIGILSRAGYATKQDRYKPNPKSAAYKYFVEYWEDKHDE